jgi:uncharacterized membrane protein YkvA (DUF1232 family)
MTPLEVDSRYLDVFPRWLETLGDDAVAVAEAWKTDAHQDEPARLLVAGLDYILRSLDLIPDGIDDLGFLDDAFVVRVACSLAIGRRAELGKGTLARLADEAGAVGDFLGSDYTRLATYVTGLSEGASRRAIDEALAEGGRDLFVSRVREWAQGYVPPTFTRDTKTLVKLKAFLSAKLPY